MGPGNMEPIRITFHTLVRYWLVSPWSITVAACLILAAFWYFQATLDVAERDDWWPPGRTAAFLGGLVALELAFQSSVAILPYISFPMLVVQRVLLVAVAPALLALGAPITLASETCSPTVEAKLSAALESRGLRALMHPVTGFVLTYLALFAFTVNLVTDLMNNVWLHDLANVGLLAAAALFWGPLVGRDRWPYWDLGPALKAAGVMLGGLVAAAIGLDLMARSTPVSPIYTRHDTWAGGAFLLVGMEIALVGAAAIVYRQWRGEPTAEEEEAEEEEAEPVPVPVEQIT
jgi:putative copper resistance protein D